MSTEDQATVTTQDQATLLDQLKQDMLAELPDAPQITCDHDTCDAMAVQNNDPCSHSVCVTHFSACGSACEVCGIVVTAFAPLDERTILSGMIDSMSELVTNVNADMPDGHEDFFRRFLSGGGIAMTNNAFGDLLNDEQVDEDA